jgi:hypothetical protein
MPHESTFELAFWECGHVEVADDVRRWLHGRQATVAAFEADFGR